MSSILLIEQSLSALQLAVMLFLMASGLTLAFGIMGLINLAHGSLYMVGGYVTAAVALATGSFLLGIVAGVAAAGVVGVLIEAIVLRRLYTRDHLHQVLATYGLILVLNEATAMVFGRQPLRVPLPAALAGSIEIVPGLQYPMYRVAIIVAGLAVALLMYLLLSRTRIGMMIRAGSTHRSTIAALGVNITLLFSLIFGLGAMLAGFAGGLAGPILGVQIGMGDNIVILTFVVVIIGGLGSLRGAVAGALLVALVDTFGRAVLPKLLLQVMTPLAASSLGAALSSMSVYVLMAVALILRPRGLFPAQK